MPITPVVTGQFVYPNKINELIAALPDINWVNFNGSNAAIRDQSGIASVIRLGLCHYRLVFATPKTRPYTVITNCNTMPGNDTGFMEVYLVTLTHCEIVAKADDGSRAENLDPLIICAIIVG